MNFVVISENTEALYLIDSSFRNASCSTDARGSKSDNTDNKHQLIRAVCRRDF
jgi:hypothetical protein